MNIRVTAQVPESAFTTIWDDPVEAQQEFVRFATGLWRGDLEPLQAAGLRVSVSVGVVPADRLPVQGIEIAVEPYRRDAFDMMRQTRELMTDQASVWARWLDSPAARALYRG